MTTFITRVMTCDAKGCAARIEAYGTLMDLRHDAAAVGWSPDPDTDLCPRHAKTGGAS
jgi:hypothetical protein